MNSNRKIAVIAGVLFIIGTVAGVPSVVSVVDDPDYLIKVSANENQVITGAFFQFIMAVAYVAVAISLYPILRKYNEGLALGFVGFRIIAGVFIIIGVIILLLLLPLSQEFVKAGAPDSSHFQTLGGLLRAGRDLVNHVAMILALNLGGLMFYYILFQTKLIPRWLSGWGLVGTTLTISASLLLMFRLIDVITTIYIGLNLPMAIQEMVLAVWLIVKGFNPSAIATGSAKQI
ncbi:MAG TPA: DUF4386 domain-containing protein [Chloroflexi bacterium]|nr:MAG: hypothetical protein B6243_04635 [Anaerolineaceae bacterium 4572_5.2]HEY84181.1 DUF4386 domain-containing protein [Chloroflexota bacterium]